VPRCSLPESRIWRERLGAGISLSHRTEGRKASVLSESGDDRISLRDFVDVSVIDADGDDMLSAVPWWIDAMGNAGDG
jgi:hypothetical protein